MEGFFTAAELEPFHREKTGSLLPKCGACGLYRQCKSPKIKPQGQGNIPVLIVGEAPNEEDDQSGHLFTGESGQLLRELVGRAGQDFNALRFTNSIICHPPQNKMPHKGKEIDWCRPNLMHTIESFAPLVIITLGSQALESVLQESWLGDIGNLERWTGAQIPLGNYWVCPTWHPAFLIQERNTVMERMFLAHLETAFAIEEAPPPLPDFSAKIEKLYAEAEVIKALRWFDETGGLIAFDYETNCLKPEYPKAKIYSCAVSNGKRTIAYPWWGKAIAATSLLLRSTRTKKIAANMKFEERWTLKHLGHPVTCWDWDTMLATHAVDNRTAVCSLKFQAFLQLGVPTYSDRVGGYLSSASGSHYNRIHELDLHLLLQYNGMDALLEWHLARKQRRVFKIA
jgi:uracil-DNA glycosylase family 4